MKKVLFVDCCIRREHSRSKQLADFFLGELQKKGEYEIESQDEPNCPKEYTLEFPETSARYLKITAKVIESLPEWHSGKGRPGFVFVDEIMVN